MRLLFSFLFVPVPHRHGDLYDFNADGIKEMLLVTGELEHDNDWGLLATKLNISITTIKDGQPINVIDDDEFVLVGAGVGQLGLSKIKGGGYALHSVWGHGHGAEEKYLFINKKGDVIISENDEQIEYDGREWYLYDSSAFTFVDNTGIFTGQDYLSFLETQLTIWARPSSETIILNSEHKDIITYKIGDNNFLKLRDIAYLLSGTKAEFNISWDSILKKIKLVSGQKYISTGDELTNTSLATKKAQETSVKIDLNKKSVSLDAYEIDGNIFVKLRDIGNLLGFSVEWNSLNSVIEINT